eukprot:5143591-Amphidinium_carterae.2
MQTPQVACSRHGHGPTATSVCASLAVYPGRGAMEHKRTDSVMTLVWDDVDNDVEVHNDDD